MTGGWARELVLARELAELGGAEALRRFRRGGAPERKADGSWVTEGDLAAEAAIRARLAEARPGDDVLGEEHGLTAAGGGPPRRGGATWVIDPIDATHSYMIGVPLWATLVGLRVDGRAVVGVCHAPALGETYAASDGGGASMNSEPVAVRETGLTEAMVASSGLRSMRRAGLEPLYRALAERCWRDRSLGDFWGHMLVARGAAQVMVDPEVKEWDYAPLEPIVREAGGVMTQLDGSPLAPGGSCLTTCGAAMHAAVLALAGRSDV
ncbi:MAG TPA: inositol monophosphatase family protein [Gaiellales bacterium]|nr:inositol monophosphatase family protein [Gaiellales bacterium]